MATKKSSVKRSATGAGRRKVKRPAAKKASAAPKVEKVRPLIEFNVDWNNAAITELREGVKDNILGLIERGKEVAQRAAASLQEAAMADPIGTKEAGQKVLNLLGMLGVKEINFKGKTYRPQDENASPDSINVE